MQRNNREIVADHEQSRSSILSPSTSSSRDNARSKLIKEQANLVPILMRRECGTGINRERAISPGMHSDNNSVIEGFRRGTFVPSSIRSIIRIDRPVQDADLSVCTTGKVKMLCFFRRIRGRGYACERCCVAFGSQEVFLEHFSGHMVKKKHSIAT